MVSHSAAMRKRVVTPSEEQEPESVNLDSKVSEVRNLISSIKKNISISNWQQLWESLNALSAIFRKRTYETEAVNNGRISQLLWWLKKNTSDISWSTKIEVLGVLKDTKGRAIESQEKFEFPSVGMFLKTPISHDGNIGKVRTKPCFEREFLLLKIYWIDIWEISRILDSKKNK